MSLTKVLQDAPILGFLMALMATIPARADEPGVIASMDMMRFQPPQKGTTRLVAGRTGQAAQFHFDKDSAAGFATSNIHGSPEWDRAAGFSFWVRAGGHRGGVPRRGRQ